MPASPRETVWCAEPHTIAKIRLLSEYLKAWYSILGTRPVQAGRPLLYVDGFAGPGEYTNHAVGSPVVAVQAAISCRDHHASGWRAGDINCAFIELDPARLAHLQHCIARLPPHPHVHPYFFAATFETQLVKVRQRLPLAFTDGSPLFVFIDPFGATGVPLPTVASILTTTCSEVLINFDADGFARNLQNDHVLDEVFGDRTWLPVRNEVSDFGVQCRRLLALYKVKLKALPTVKHVFSFEMRASAQVPSYHLVFATGHPLGLKKMKEAMRAIDQTGEYRFTDADVDQPRLLPWNDPTVFGAKMAAHFSGKAASYTELDNWALDETDYTNPKEMLKFLESSDRIEVEAVPGAVRKKGTFPAEKIHRILFR